MIRVCVAISAVVIATALLGPAAGADTQATRIVDRTFVCAVALKGGIRQVEIQAGKTQVLKGFALFDVASHWVPDHVLAGVGDDVVDWNPRRCKPSSVSVPLRRGGLERVAPWGGTGVELDCETPRQVLVRVRAVFRAPVTPRLVSWDSIGSFRVLVARGRLVEGSLAVRTRTGRPVMYGFVNRARQARLFAASTCYPD